MSTPTNAEAFLDRLASDEAFRNALTTQVNSSQGLRQFARSEGYDFNDDQFGTAFRARYGDVIAACKELPDASLDAVSGGGFFGDFLRTLTDGVRTSS